MLVKPAPGLLVRDPISKLPLLAEGAEVPESTYWLRRLAHGDVLMVTVCQIRDSQPAAPETALESEAQS